MNRIGLKITVYIIIILDFLSGNPNFRNFRLDAEFEKLMTNFLDVALFTSICNFQLEI